MLSKSIAQTSRGDPLFVFLILALAIVAVPAFSRASDDPPAGPAGTITRTATRAIAATEFPDDEQGEPLVTAPAPEAPGVFEEPRIIRRGIDLATRTIGDGTSAKSGLYPEFSNMLTGSGWLSIGPGYRKWLFNDRAFADTSAALSWRMYKMMQGRFEFPNLARSRLMLGSQIMWQDSTQVSYFGTGSGSLQDDRSEFRVQSTDVVGYGAVRPVQWLAVGGRIGYLAKPWISEPGGTFKRGYPDTFVTFPDDPAVRVADQPSYVHAEASVTADTRDARSHPTHGGVYRATATRYSDRTIGTYSFRRYEAEAAHFIGLFDDNLVLAGRGWVVATDTDPGRVVPFYMLPSLGGHNTLRAYTDYRFHDRNFAVVNLESRIAVWTHLDFAAFVDAGNVAGRFADLNLDKRDWGVGLRMHANQATFARVDVAHGTDGWRVIFRTSDPLHLSHMSRRTAAVPFVP